MVQEKEIQINRSNAGWKSGLTLAVVFGGCSSEYEVSLHSAASVIESLDREKYEIILIGITRQGDWYRYDGPIDPIRQDTWFEVGLCTPAFFVPDRRIHGLVELAQNGAVSRHVDVVFPVLHGKNGEDGSLQGLLDLAGIPYVGCGLLSSALCMDKDIAHRLVQQTGIRIPRSYVFGISEDTQKILVNAAAIGYPLFVKPANAGSSFGISKVARESDLADAVREAFNHDRKVILEEAIPGREIGCAVLGTGSLMVGQLDEVELSGGFFDYVEKYTLETAKIHLPARVEASVAQRLQEAAVTVYRALGCSGMARVDFFLTPANEIVFNEANAIPGFTEHSRYPQMLKAAGMRMGAIVDALINQAVTQ